ncbi:GNAT family N-acetyltransferase [bacterium]|nr:GNAT family N-acetyltransferase [bacterium]
MHLELSNCTVRSYLPSDAESLAQYANNRKIWLNLRDAFPHPYRIEHAYEFIQKAAAMDPETYFAICVDDRAVGGIGYVLHTDVERISAELGYWLGEPFWGKGIVTEALKAVTAYAFGHHELMRIHATPFAVNKGSCRVLEKAGYVYEGRMRKSAIKDGKVLDKLMYAAVR